MDTKAILENLQQLRSSETRAYISLKASGDTENSDISIHANRNGILVLCDQMLRSIDSSHLEKDAIYQLPDQLFDESDVWITDILIEEGNKNPELVKESIFSQAGCVLIGICFAGIFLTGLITAFSWLANIF